MARELTEIYNELVAEKNTFTTLNGLQPAIDDSQTLLNDLSTTSKVAIWRLVFFVVAVGIWTHENIFDLHKAEIEALAAEFIGGTVEWFQFECLKFQLGDTLQFINQKFSYPIIDETKQIDDRCAIDEVAGQLRIKVAKLDPTLPVPLSTPELNAFKAYVDEIKFAGVNVFVTSGIADQVRLTMKVVYNPLALSATGEDIDNPGVFPVEDAITAHVSNLPFNGVLNLTSLTDSVQAVGGVVDPILLTIDAKFGALPYAAVVENYKADAGYLEIDPAFPLNTSITYTANV